MFFRLYALHDFITSMDPRIYTSVCPVPPLAALPVQDERLGQFHELGGETDRQLG